MALSGATTTSINYSKFENYIVTLPGVVHGARVDIIDWRVGFQWHRLFHVVHGLAIGVDYRPVRM
jgi:hypothetical protein